MLRHRHPDGTHRCRGPPASALPAAGRHHLRGQRLVAALRRHAGVPARVAGRLRPRPHRRLDRRGRRRRLRRSAPVAAAILHPARDRAGRHRARAGDHRHALPRRRRDGRLQPRAVRPHLRRRLGPGQRRVLRPRPGAGWRTGEPRPPHRSHRLARAGDLRPALHRHDRGHGLADRAAGGRELRARLAPARPDGRRCQPRGADRRSRGFGPAAAPLAARSA